MKVQICEELFRHVNKTQNIYVDFTGGLRDLTFLMSILLRYMEFSGAVCCEIVYSNYEKKRIESIHYIYELFQMINATNDFVSTGNASQLKRLFEGDTLNDSLQKLLDSIVCFSNTISICNVGEVDEAVSQTVSAINRFRAEKGIGNMKEMMLQKLLPVIEEKLFLNQDMVQNGRVNYPLLIRWCLDNRLVQQAITLYVEKMPQYYFQETIVGDIINLDIVKERAGGSKEANGLYTTLFSRIDKGKEYFEFLVHLDVFLDQVIKLKDDKKRLEQIRKNSTNSALPKEYQKAYGRLNSIATAIYNKKERPKIYRTDCNQRNVREFLSDTKLHEKNQHYLFYNNKHEYDMRKKYQGKKNVYQKKVYALQLLENGERKEELPDTLYLHDILCYYLAIKLLRNRVNNASDIDITEDESRAIDYLMHTNISGNRRITIETNYENVIELLSDGLEVSLHK